ncbi:OpgC domain-containing protein [Marivirga sp. S37H4]|uniref:OpgC domain-containing protein n=1 Tax=Marivirga aurantiaca TaxID=2802615 RepID=A0A934X0B2_9BACT|nr:OpgC domain-containing protein [Marivirga aurantiaca]MBK6266534.1 OpgC domain-containing protein [Marivirga aurantiaca]
MKERVYFVDFVRSYAIFLALFDHSLNDFNIWANYSFEQYAVVKLFTTSATPTFLFLFGMMLELVYLKRLRKVGLPSIKPKLYKRSFQCYLGFILTSLAGLIGGYLTIKGAIGTTFFAVNNHYGNILKIYCVMILLAIPLLLLRNKYGIWFIVVLCCSYWLTYPFTSQMEIQHGNIAIFMSSIFGIGGSGGPSVFHSLSIVSIGMLSASFIDFEHKWKFQRINFYLLLILLSLIAVVIYTTPWDELLNNYFTNTYRNNNHPIYYLVALSLAVIHVLFFSSVIPLGIKLKPWTRYLMVFGRNSLSAFTIGNIILNLIFKRIEDYSFNLFAPLLFIFFVYIILFFYEKFESRKELKTGAYNT